MGRRHDGKGAGRSPSISRRMRRDRSLATATSANWKVTYRPCLTTLAPNLDQLLPQRRQRPMLHLFRQSPRPHEVGKIVGQGVKLEPDGVVAELAARQSGPLDGVLAFLDVLLRFTPLIVESNHPLGGARQVGDDKADTRTEFTRVPFHLGHDTTLPVPASGLIAEAGILAQDMVGRTADGSCEQVGDACLKNRVGLETDSVLVANDPGCVKTFFRVIRTQD